MRATVGRAAYAIPGALRNQVPGPDGGGPLAMVGSPQAPQLRPGVSELAGGNVRPVRTLPAGSRCTCSISSIWSSPPTIRLPASSLLRQCPRTVGCAVVAAWGQPAGSPPAAAGPGWVGRSDPVAFGRAVRRRRAAQRGPTEQASTTTGWPSCDPHLVEQLTALPGGARAPTRPVRCLCACSSGMSTPPQPEKQSKREVASEDISTWLSGPGALFVGRIGDRADRWLHRLDLPVVAPAGRAPRVVPNGSDIGA